MENNYIVFIIISDEKNPDQQTKTVLIYEHEI